MSTIDNRVHRILVLEDEPAIGHVCRRVLTNQGFEVDVAPNAKTAQGMIERKRYVLCLIDIRTPGMSGKEFYYWLKNRCPKLSKKVIFTTGDVMAQDVRNFLKETGRAFLPKPFTPDELSAKVRESLIPVEIKR